MLEIGSGGNAQAPYIAQTVAGLRWLAAAMGMIEEAPLPRPATLLRATRRGHVTVRHGGFARMRARAGTIARRRAARCLRVENAYGEHVEDVTQPGDVFVISLRRRSEWCIPAKPAAPSSPGNGIPFRSTDQGGWRWLALNCGAACSVPSRSARWRDPPLAQAPWPTRPITLVVTYAPGGSADVLARLIGPVMAQELGQPVVVENRAGAGGNVGSDFVARAAPDGHVVQIVQRSAHHAINKELFGARLPFDPQRSFTPVRCWSGAGRGHRRGCRRAAARHSRPPPGRWPPAPERAEQQRAADRAARGDEGHAAGIDIAHRAGLGGEEGLGPLQLLQRGERSRRPR